MRSHPHAVVGHACSCLVVPAGDSVPLCTSTLPSHYGPTWDQSMSGRVGLPSFTPAFSEAADPFAAPGKGGFDEPHFGRKPGGAGYRQHCLPGFPPCWHLPGGEVLPGQPCPAPGTTLPRHVSGTRCTSQGCPAAWHGCSAVPEASPKQRSAMSPHVTSLRLLSVAQHPSPLMVSASGCPSGSAAPWDHLKHG